MTQISQNLRFLFFSIILGASFCGIANAQDVTVKDSEVSTSVNDLNRRMFMLTEEGSFKYEFASLSDVLDASMGNSYNQTLKKGNEIIVMNARCGDGAFIDTITFSIYQMDGKRADAKDLSPIIKSYLDNITNQGQSATADRELIDKVMKSLSAYRFPQKNACDPVPVALSFISGPALRLEVDDAQNPLIGTKFNDGTLYEALRQNARFMASTDAKSRAFWEKYGHNNFSNIQDAADIAGVFAGTKAIIFNGSTFSIYRIDAFKFPDNTDGSRNFDVLKTTPMPEGWIITTIVSGKKFIQIYDPNSN